MISSARAAARGASAIEASSRGSAAVLEGSPGSGRQDGHSWPPASRRLRPRTGNAKGTDARRYLELFKEALVAPKVIQPLFDDLLLRLLFFVHAEAPRDDPQDHGYPVILIRGIFYADAIASTAVDLRDFDTGELRFTTRSGHGSGFPLFDAEVSFEHLHPCGEWSFYLGALYRDALSIYRFSVGS